MAIIAITTSNELVGRVLQSVSLQARVLHRALDPLLVRLFGPVGALVVIEGCRRAELTMQYLGFVLDALFDLFLV